jgi:tape measure domain-containing protein
LIVRELITRLGFSLNKTQLDNAEKGVRRVKDRAEEAATAFRNMAAAVVSFATVKAIINIADDMQNIRTRIGQLPQTVGDAGDAFDEVARRASASGQSIAAYSALYTRVGNAAKDYITTQQDLLSVTDTISQALVVGGANTQEASSAMIQFSQALASGVLQGDEFRSMAEAAPQYLDKLAETMKIPREQLKKMASDGKLTAKAVIDATRQMSDYFGDKFKQMPMTVGRAMTVIGNRFARMLDKMNRDSNFVTTIANAILSMFDKIETGVYKLVEAFGGWGNMLRFVGITLGVALGAKALSILAAFRAASLLALLPFIKIIAIITAVALVLEDLYVWINGGDSIIGSLLGPWEEWRPYVMAAIEMVIDAFKWLGQVIAAIGAILVGAFTLDANLFKVGLEELGSLLWSALSAWATWWWETFSTVMTVISSYFAELLTQWGTAIRDAFVNAFTAVTAYVTETFAAWGSMIYNAIFLPIVNAVSDAWNKVKGLASGAWEGAKSFVGLGSDTGAGTGPGATPASTVAPAQLAPAAMGAGRPNVQSNTNVTVTVPPGTTAEQAAFLQNAAQQSFSKGANDKLARDLSVYAP